MGLQESAALVREALVSATLPAGQLEAFVVGAVEGARKRTLTPTTAEQW
jgi:hypothetical protein